MTDTSVVTERPVTVDATAVPRPRRSRIPAVAAGVLGALAVAYRGWLVGSDVPVGNSDEATAGLAALHIAAGEHFPVFFYGQHYLGTLQSYLAAPWVAAFGPQWWTLRAPPLLLYAGFLALMFLLTRRLFSPWFAVAAVGLLALGADRVVRNQLIGGGGYPETLFGVALLCVLTALLALRPAGRWTAAGWGVTAGLILWTHWLALPYVLACLGVVAWALRGRWRRVAVPLLAGALLGAAPLLVANLAGDGPNSLSVLLSVSGATQEAPLLDRAAGAVLLGIPLTTGLCDPGHCGPAQHLWGPAYVLLLLAAAVLAVREIRLLRAAGRPAGAAVLRLMLVIGGGLTLAAYIASASAADTPMESARYLHYSLVSLPAVLWPLWRPAVSLVSGTALGRAAIRAAPGGVRAPVLPRQRAFPRRVGRAVRAVAAATVLGAVAVGAVAATVTSATSVAALGRERQDEVALIAALEERSITRFYSEYWTCNRIAYLTDERLVCAVLGEDLRAGLDRLPAYRGMVAAAGPAAAFVLPHDAAVLPHLDEWLRREGIGATTEEVAGYRIIRPARATGLPQP